MKPSVQRKGQTSMVLIILLIIIFIALVVFLLSIARNASQDDYMELYINNLMLSIMKTDTGNTDTNCKLVSDAVACAFVLPDWPCGDSHMTCSELANKSLIDYTESFDLITQNYRYLFTVYTHEFIARTGENLGQGKYMEYGDTTLDDDDAVSRRTANYAIQKSLSGHQYNLRVTLYLARKTS